MSTCSDNVCGTGEWAGPKPGDPNLNGVTLQATAEFGGIRLSWTYPTIAPEALAYTKIFRATEHDYSKAIERVIATGSSYFDMENTPAAYYYWIIQYSVHGTAGDLVGPAVATLRSRGDISVEDLYEKIDKGVLSQALKTDIEEITRNAEDIRAEILARINADNALGDSMYTIQNGLDNAIGLLATEVSARLEGQNALINQYEILAAANKTNAAAITTEREIRLSADEALASEVSRVDAAAKDAAAAVQSEATTRATQDAALAQQINTTQSTLGNQIASVETKATTALGNANSALGKANAIGALYTVKVGVNGLVGGFGIYNNGQEVEAGFDVDTFWVGRTQGNKAKPFVVSGNTVYLDKARIREGDIDTLKIKSGSVTSMSGGYGDGVVTPPGGEAIIASCAITVSSGSSGVVVSGTTTFTASSTASVYFSLRRRGHGQIQAGFTWAGVEGKWFQNAAVTGFDMPPPGVVWYDFVCISPTSGPDPNKQITNRFSSITATGGNR